MVFIILLILILCISKVYFDTNIFKTIQIDFHSDKIPRGSEVRIVQLSDLHNKVFGVQNAPLVEAIKKVNPDLVVLTGDLIDRTTKNLGAVFHLVENILALNKDVYFVTGNHEWDNAKLEIFLEGLRQRQVTILDNKSIVFDKNGMKITIVGVDDYTTKHHQLPQALEGRENEHYTVLLSHSPDIVKSGDALPVDLILSGHTHGGQIRLPFIGALIAPGQGLFPKLNKGIYTIGKNQYLYVDSGLGTSNLPIRFFCQSQFSVITIKCCGRCEKLLRNV